MKYIIYLTARTLVALTFIFSGLVKIVDPMGMMLKLQEYYAVYRLGFMEGSERFFSVFLPGMELLLGLLLLVGIYRAVTSKLVFAAMIAYTILTVHIFIADPVSDCGCFGDALKLSNGATLAKNIVLLLLSALVVLLLPKIYKKGEKRFSKVDLAYFSCFALFSFGIGVYSMIFVPPFDFLPYGIGAELNTGRGEQPRYRTTLVYENLTSGEQRKFDPEDTTWYDTARWRYVSTLTERVGEGDEQPRPRFDLFDAEGNDMSAQLLERDGYVFLIMAPDMADLTRRDFEKVATLLPFAAQGDLSFAFVTASLPEEAEERVRSGLGASAEIYSIDHTLMNTIFRAPKGVLVLGDGTILDKLAFSQFRGVRDTAQIGEMVREAANRKRNYWIILGITLFVLVGTYLPIKSKERWMA